MMISVGSDILEIARVERLQKKGRVERIFTEEERRQSEGKASRLAGDFSVKEAVAKALGTGIRGFSLLDIEVLRTGFGGEYFQHKKSGDCQCCNPRKRSRRADGRFERNKKIFFIHSEEESFVS